MLDIFILEKSNTTLQIMYELVKRDNRYKLYIAGKFQDDMLKMYWYYQVKEMKLDNNIIFDGWQSDIEEWLENKNYILSTSIHESFGYGIAEAMASGIKPVIHNFYLLIKYGRENIFLMEFLKL